MKSKCTFILKTSVALVLALMMLFGSISGVIAATVDMAANGYYWDNGNWYLKSDIDSWGTGLKMTNNSSNNDQAYKDIYLFGSASNSNFNFKFKEEDGSGNDSWFGPNSGSDTACGTSGTQGGEGKNGNYYINRKDLGTTATTVYKVRIWFEHANWVGAWYDKSATYASLAPTLTAPSTGTVGTAISLTGSYTSANKVGTVTGKYQYSTDNGTTWNDLSSGSYTATSAGTVKFRYKVTDGGVVAGTNSTANRVEYSSEKSCTISAAATTYTSISANAKGSNDGSTYGTTLSGTPATISANSYTTGTTALTITAAAVSGYTFAQWKVTAGSGTIGSTTSASTTFTPSASSTTVTAQYKKNYTISKNSPSNGTITLNKTSAVAGESYTVTLAPAAGYKVSAFTVGGVDKKSSLSNNVYTGTASGSSASIACSVTYALDDTLKLGVAGRFHVRTTSGGSTWMNTWGSGSGDWSDTGFNGDTAYIPFVWDSTAGKYKVQTYASLAELSDTLSSSTPYLYVYNKTKSKYLYSSTSKAFTASVTEVTLTEYSSKSSTYDQYLKFNSTSTDTPVILWFDATTNKLSYTVPDFYDITVATATGGSVTASPTRAAESSTVTLSISANEGYELNSLVAKKTGDTSTTVTISGTGNSRTFTMPAYGVTVTPGFTKITWSGLSAVGKYSTTGASGSYTNTWSSGGPNVTIAATSATQLDGVAVTAPDSYTTGGVTYKFAQWAATNGSVTGDTTSNDTHTATFKPTAANAVATAQYKKVYTITIGANETGEGTGTVTRSVTTVVAGGSYTITLTPDSYSIVDSLKINNSAVSLTAGSGNVKTYTSTAIANVTAVGKFTTDVKLGNKGFDGTNNWTEPKMTSNGDGTYSYIFSNVASGRTAQFKAKVGDTYKDYSDTTTFDDGGTSCKLTSIYDGGTNYKLTTTEAVKVTIIYTASSNMITSVVLDPISTTTYAITVGSPADATLTATYRGTTYNEGQTIAARAGQQISFSATAATGKYITGYKLDTATVTSPYTVTASDDGKTLTCTTADKATITATTNKSDRGTVSVSTNSIIPGQTFTITVTEKSGKLSSLSYTERGANSWSKTTDFNISTGVAATSSGAKGDFASTGADLDQLAADGVANFTSNAVNSKTTSIQVEAVFSAYSADSEYYYNGFNTSGTVLSDYDTKQMTEVMLNGVPYSYYYVEGRTGNEQLMTVSKGSSDTKFYVETPAIADWNNSDPKIYWFDDNWGTFTTMHFVRTISTENGYEKKLWYVSGDEIHPGQGCLIINGKEGGSFKQTTDMSAAEVAFGAVWIRTDLSDGKYNWQRYSDTDKNNLGDAGDQTVHYYYNDDNRFYGNVTDFNDTANSWDQYNANNHTFARPHTPSGNYYVLVFYAGNTYTSGEGTLNLTGSANHDVVMWAYELPGGEENVTVYAKDGAIRTESFGVTYANIADTKIYSDANHTTAVGVPHDGQISGQTYETYKADKGQKLYIRTIINNTAGNGTNTQANNVKYYVRGFCVNGVVSKINSGTSDGTAVTGGTAYDLTYTVPEDYEDKYIEITPIYYLVDTTNNPIVTFRVLDFPKDKYNWGDTLYCYPFYGKLGGQNNAFGAYPGQPIVYYNGQYSIQIPTKSTAWDLYLSDTALSGSDSEKRTQVSNTFVSGITMSNGYYDSVHRTVMGYGGNGSSSDHVQTYDYGDFYKIFNEKSPVDNIVFDFKYRTAKHNFENQPAASITKNDLITNYDTNGNGFELLKNFHGRNVDLFGTPLSGDAADPTKTTPVYVVSIGGVNGSGGVENIAGYYATEWMVYGSNNGTNYTRITSGSGSNQKNSIPPEVLVLNDYSNSFNNNTYPSAVSGVNITDWQALYHNLETYRGKPVYITYEAADAQIGSGNYATSGGGGATRNDGRWLYSKKGESITSNIKIQYSNNDGATYTDLNTTTPQVANLSAYFTNAEVSEGATTFSTTIDPDKTFNFEAVTTNPNYMFVGWYMDDTNNTLITTDNIGKTERSGSYTFIARFKLVTDGQLVLQHSTATDGTYAGSGTSKISVVIKNGDEVLQEYPDADTITIPNRFIKSTNKSYTIEVTLKATPSGYDTYGTTLLDTTDTDVTTAKFYNNPASSTSGSTQIRTVSFTIGDLYDSGTTQLVNSLLYHSYFNKITFRYKYTFRFPSRGSSSNDKSYVREGTLTNAQIDSYVSTGSTKILDSAFVNTLIPHESNFNVSYTWGTITDAMRTFSYSNNTYSINQTIDAAVDESEGARSTDRTVTFDLPYAHTNGVATVSEGIVNEATSLNYDVPCEYGELVIVNNSFVTAPNFIYEDETQKYFQYWAVYKTKSSGEYTDSEIVAKCYFVEFNLLAFDNYYIRPVYATTQIDWTTTGISTTISYLDTTRNQYNSDGTDAGRTNVAKAADLLYSDFVLAYNYNDVDIYKGEADSNAITEIGLVVERVQKLEVKQDGTPYTDPTKYSGKGVDTSAIQAFITSGTNTTGNTLSKHTLNKTQLDNKNRIELYDMFYNSSGWKNAEQTPDTKYAYKNYAFKAYSYMIVNGTIYLSDSPAYFTMYDEATK